MPAVEGSYRCTTAKGECSAVCCVGVIETPTELALYHTFHREALAAHAHASPSRVEIEFGRACDRLRAGLKLMRGQAADELAAEGQRLGLYDAVQREEEAVGTSPQKMEADPT